jgi:membrane peptidoglycan carboxypeptidase
VALIKVRTWVKNLAWRRLLVRTGLASVVGLGLLSSIAVLTYLHYASAFESPSQLGVNQPSPGAKILDRNGKLLYEYVDDREGLRVPVKLADLPPDLLAATISTEDSSFYTNPGINPKGMVRAVWDNFNPISGHFLDGSGGSSITQQLIKNLYFSSQERSGRSLTRKAREAVYAVELTKRYDKNQILEWYLNQISYGGVFNGIDAASEGYFSKPAKDLTLAQAALLAGIPQSPAQYSPILHPEAAVARRNEVLKLMDGHDRIQIGPDAYYTPGRADIEAAIQAPLELSPQHFPIEAPHFVLSYVQPELVARFGQDALYRDGLTVTTSLDLDLQNQAQEVLERRISQYEAQSNAHNGAVLIIEPKTGEILTMIGSRDFFRDDIQGQNNNAIALNSPGSTFKPFVYLESFLKLGWSPGNPIDDTPVSYRNADGSVFQPRDPSGVYQGTITIRNALGNSLNVPAFKTAMAVGVPDIVAFGKKAGFTTLNGSYGPAIAIGGVDLTQLDLTFGYSMLANGGVLRGERSVTPHGQGERALDPIAILKVTDSHGRVLLDINQQRGEQRVAPPEQTFMVNSILSDPNDECLTFGCGGLGVPGVSMAVKTGTSEPYDPIGPNAGKIGETWAFGYTPDVVISVWAGNADNSRVTNILSTTIAFPIVRDIAQAYFNGRPVTPFAPPAGVVLTRGCFASTASSRCLNGQDYVLRSSLAELGPNVAGPGSLLPTVVRTPPRPAPTVPKQTQPPPQKGKGKR